MAHETTTVQLTGKGTNPKTTLYVGGLEESVTPAVLQAAFLPFGEVKDVSIPLDHATGQHRGFGFVEFEEASDAEAAVANMHDGELYGRVLRVNLAASSRIKGGSKGWASQAVWADADDWYERAEAERTLVDEEDRQAKEKARRKLRAEAGLDDVDDPMTRAELQAEAGGEEGDK